MANVVSMTTRDLTGCGSTTAWTKPGLTYTPKAGQSPVSTWSAPSWRSSRSRCTQRSGIMSANLALASSSSAGHVVRSAEHRTDTAGHPEAPSSRSRSAVSTTCPHGRRGAVGVPAPGCLAGLDRSMASSRT